MYAEERLQLIVARARAQGRVDVAALAAELGVTPETVRQDLTSLERQGLLRRVHGGAIPVERLGFEPAVGQRAEHYQEEKDRIAKAAIAELPVEGAILLDSGTTTARLAEMLPLDCELTVVTNSLPIALSLSVRPNLQVLVTGGRVRSRTLAAVGDWAGDALASVRVDVAFLGANGISAALRPDHPGPGRGGGQAGHDPRGAAAGGRGRPQQARRRLLRPLRRAD